MNNFIVQAIRDRRPLRAREIGPWKRAAACLARLRVTPNMVSGAGLVFGVVSGFLLAATGRTEWASHAGAIGVLAVGAILLRGCCNILDGVLALETGTASPLGTLWNEMPDRLSDVATLVGAGYAIGGSPFLGWAAALAALLTSYVRIQVRLAGAAMDFRGPMAKPARMTVVSVCVLWSITPPALHPAFGRDGRYGPVAIALAAVTLGCFITIWRRLHAAAASLRTTP